MEKSLDLGTGQKQTYFVFKISLVIWNSDLLSVYSLWME